MNYKIKIIIVMTCHNRCEQTLRCIESLLDGKNRILEYEFIIVDDNSTDGTSEEIEKKYKHITTVLKGNGQLYYSGGMRIGIGYIKQEKKEADYIMLVNDDVLFDGQAVSEMIENGQRKEVLIGATKGNNGILSYGGIKYNNGIKYHMVGPKSEEQCDTFNANCVLIPKEIFETVDNIDPVYVHSLGDFDYGLSISKAGFVLTVNKEFVGICDDNSHSGSWRDVSLSRYERIKLKEQEKGVPIKEWYYFLKKNFGVSRALFYSITPYIRILLKK